MEYMAAIQWNETNKLESVVISTDKETEEEDYVFFYFKDVEEIELHKEIGMNEFRIIRYVPTTDTNWYDKINWYTNK